MSSFLSFTRSVVASSLLVAALAVGCAAAPADDSLGSEGAALSHADDRIAKAVAELESEAILPGPGRNDEFAVKVGTDLDMVKSYIKAKYADDTEIGDAYTFKADAAGLDTDEEVAGTLKTSVAIRESIDSIKGWYSEEEGAESQAHIAKVRAIFEKMVAAGATFGFDGFEQNACAAPTGFLLVIDRSAKKVYGVDLNPCEE